LKCSSKLHRRPRRLRGLGSMKAVKENLKKRGKTIADGIMADEV